MTFWASRHWELARTSSSLDPAVARVDRRRLYRVTEVTVDFEEAT